MYQKFIERIRLDKNPSLDIILNKVGETNNDYRNFPMEILDERIGQRIRVRMQWTNTLAW